MQSANLSNANGGKIVRFGLVGCGGIAARHLDAISSLPGAHLVAVADTDMGRAQAIAERLQVRAYDDYRQMLQEQPLDIVVVLTPSGSHAEIAITCMEQGKHVLVEKPLALNAEDARRIAQQAQAKGVRAFVVHQNRFNPPVQKLWQSIHEGRLGRIVLGSARVRWCRPQKYYDQAKWRGTWKSDGGVFANQAVHHIDLLLWLAGPIDSVFATGARAMAKIETEDLGVAVLRFASGAIGSLEATTCARPRDIESSVSILGDKATVEIAGTSLDRVQVWEFAEGDEQDQQFLAVFTKSPNEFSKKGHLRTYEALLEFMSSGHVGCLTSAEEGLKSIEVLEAIYESMVSGREVKVGSRSMRPILGQRSEDGVDVQNLPERENWDGSSDRGLLHHRSAASGT